MAYSVPEETLLTHAVSLVKEKGELITLKVIHLKTEGVLIPCTVYLLEQKLNAAASYVNVSVNFKIFISVGFLASICICSDINTNTTNSFPFGWWIKIQHGEELCISTMQQVRIYLHSPMWVFSYIWCCLFSSWFQLDFAATISALLGIPFPFGRSVVLTWCFLHVLAVSQCFCLIVTATYPLFVCLLFFTCCCCCSFILWWLFISSTSC